MSLEQLIHRLPELDDDDCIFARRPWSPDSEATTATLTDFQIPSYLSSAHLEYFLEVSVAKEVLEVFGDRPGTNEEQIRLLIFYAENDAYPEWIYER